MGPGLRVMNKAQARLASDLTLFFKTSHDALMRCRYLSYVP